ncbi:OLC1v1032166C1 [Oldenlandia corymbosa var. corymbosa]|uniref:poly(A)-specific ribonuclease n=1 Tax=Oldenlandia corymbosa var. corymbosa TaxID=529605 RepID=A0AAV1CK34_OLDCO|nr:OLC1v1032166C1 [Oldenlandia corymbosa var. corymbosa]
MPPTVRVVNSSNLRYEFRNINSVLRKNNTSFVAVDTEFPGIYHKSEKPYFRMSGEEHYGLMRKNVNELKLIQLGLTVSDESGKNTYIWEFNFRDFDLERDLGDVDSINMLKKQGIDFHTNRQEGISSVDFAREFVSSDLGFSLRWSLAPAFVSRFNPNVNWVFFHCNYDIGYFIRMLTQRHLPEKLTDFLELVTRCLGDRIYDLKEIVKFEPFGWQCGLDKVAKNLNMKRRAGQSHQAGSDSLLTLDCFFAAMRALNYQRGLGAAQFALRAFNYKLFGLAVDEAVMKKLDLMQNGAVGQYPEMMYDPYVGTAGGFDVGGFGVPVMSMKGFSSGHLRMVPLTLAVPIFGL